MLNNFTRFEQFCGSKIKKLKNWPREFMKGLSNYKNINTFPSNNFFKTPPVQISIPIFFMDRKKYNRKPSAALFWKRPILVYHSFLP